MEAKRADRPHKLPAVATGGALPQPKTPSGQTQGLQLNYVRSATAAKTEIEKLYLNFLGTTAQRLGLTLHILTQAQHRDDIEQVLQHHPELRPYCQILETPQAITKWAEDGVEYLTNGTIATLPLWDEEWLAAAMQAGRRQRWRDYVSPEFLDSVLQDDHLWIPLGVRANTSGMSLALAAVARAKQSAFGHLRAYIEGGNMITGEDATGNPIILVGKDAIDTTAYLYQMSSNQVRDVIREDFGLTTIDHVIPVEQPGQFHLDLALLFLGQGVVVLNDCSTAYHDAQEIAEAVPCLTTTTAAAKLTLQYQLEAAAARDLQAAGLTVLRHPLADGVAFNFFNGEFVTGKDGLNYYITNGASPEEEARFYTLMVQEWKVVADVIFSPIEATRSSLQELGGIGCRLKGVPTQYHLAALSGSSQSV